MKNYSVKDIAKDLGLGARTIHKYIQEGFLPCNLELWGSRQIYSIEFNKYQKWKHKHFSGIAKGKISKLTNKVKELGKNQIKEEWIPEWLDWLSTGKLGGKAVSPRMIEIYDYYFNYYLKLLPPRPSLPVISVNNFRNVLGKIPVEKYSTRANTFSAIMSITKYLIEKDLFNQKQRDAIKKLRPKRYLPAKKPCINETQLQEVLDFLNKRKHGGYYNALLSKTLILFIARTGLRASEVANLTLSDINLESGVVSVIHGKGRKNRKVAMNQELKTLLAEYLKARLKAYPGEHFFAGATGTPMNASTIHQKIERVAQHFDFHFNPHALRRSFVTINVNKGHQLVHLQIACGHADITTTRGYCRTSEDEVLEAMKSW